MNDLGWHVIHGEDLLSAMRRTAAGEDPDHVYVELWANAEHEQVTPTPTLPAWLMEAAEAHAPLLSRSFGGDDPRNGIPLKPTPGAWRWPRWMRRQPRPSVPPPNPTDEPT